MSSNPAFPTSRHFQFKQFSLSDEGCAMKIGTDGVLLGSVAATYPGTKVLDIGTGCGLIALMISQENPGKITAIEPEEGAVNIALENVNNSPWSERIEIIKCRLQDFSASVKEKFDLVVCNPPYFSNSLQSPDPERNLARHSDSLPSSDLFRGVSDIINPEGIFLIIIPVNQEIQAERLGSLHALNCRRKILVSPAPGRKPVRIIMAFSPTPCPLVSEQISIENGIRHHFSDAYKKLTGKFYLKF